MNTTPEIEIEDQESTRKDINDFRLVMSTIKSATEDQAIAAAQERKELFDRQVGLLVKAKQKAGWTSRRIKRFIKTTFNVDINFK